MEKRKKLEQLIQVVHLLEQYEGHLEGIRSRISRKTFDDAKMRIDNASNQILKVVEEIGEV